MKLAIDQPNYIPWKGYFDIIHDVDLFIFYNDVQYTTRDWRNRNRIITPNGEKWLSIPAGKDADRMICEVQMKDTSWQRKHFETIRYAYSKAPYYSFLVDFLEDVYINHEWEYLYELDQYITIRIARDFLGLDTQFADSRDYQKAGRKHEKLMSLIDAVGGWTSMCLALRQRITSSLYGIYIIGRKWLRPEIAVGYSSIMAVMLFSSGLIMLMLGMIGEYLGRIYICINNSPQYVVRETINIEKV